MSDALISSLNARVSDLTTENAQMKAALREARGDLKAARAERDEFAQTITDLEKDRDAWKGKAEAAPGEKDARIKELEGQIAGDRHRAAYEKAAKAAGMLDEEIADSYDLAMARGTLKLGEGDAKPEDFAAHLSAAREARPRAFGEAPAGGGSSTAPPAGKGAGGGGSQAPAGGGNAAPIAGGRGASGTSPSRVQYSLSDVRKPGWQQANPALAEALAKGDAVCIG